jgi:hypothetical protein
MDYFDSKVILGGIMKRILLALIMFTASLATVGCTEGTSATKPAMPTPTVSQVKPNFIPPTAEQAYRLQDDCTRRGEVVLRGNLIGSALTQEEVPRYNSLTNRCYVRLDVHAADLRKSQDMDYSIYLYDGQTNELLAYVRTEPRFDKNGHRKVAFLGFGCDITGEPTCVEEKMAACIQGKECDPQ